MMIARHRRHNEAIDNDDVLELYGTLALAGRVG
jgi:hypothetical protein